MKKLIRILVAISLLLGTAEAVDKQEVAAHVFSWAATIGDLETTAAAQRNRQCRELDPIYGQHPTRARTYAVSVPIAIGASLLAHRMKKRNGKYWAWPLLANGAAHASGILVNNFSGCYY